EEDEQHAERQHQQAAEHAPPAALAALHVLLQRAYLVLAQLGAQRQTALAQLLAAADRRGAGRRAPLVAGAQRTLARRALARRLRFLAVLRLLARGGALHVRLRVALLHLLAKLAADRCGLGLALPYAIGALDRSERGGHVAQRLDLDGIARGGR